MAGPFDLPWGGKIEGQMDIACDELVSNGAIVDTANRPEAAARIAIV